MRTLVIIGFAGLAAAPSQAQPWSRCFGQLWAFETGGGVSVNDVSGDGRVVVGRARTAPAGAGYAFRWSPPPGGLQFLEDGQWEPVEDAAWGVSADGTSIVGEHLVGSYIWREPNLFTVVPPLDPDDARSIARAANEDGSVVVGSSPRSWMAYRWTSATGAVALPSPLPDRARSRAYDVSNDGGVIVGAVYGEGPMGQGQYAARWDDDAGWELLTLFDGARQNRSLAYAVSGDGRWVVGATASDNGDREAFRWSEATGALSLGDLQPPGMYDSIPWDIDDKGRTIVGSGFIWTERAGMRSAEDVLRDDYFIDLSGWDSLGPRAISGDGLTIAGVGRRDSDQYTVGFVAFLPPECPADFTGSVDPNDPGYGVPDGAVDVSDFFYYIDIFVAGHPDADITGPGSYCRPDGTVGVEDYFHFLDLFVFGCR